MHTWPPCRPRRTRGRRGRPRRRRRRTRTRARPRRRRRNSTEVAFLKFFLLPRTQLFSLSLRICFGSTGKNTSSLLLLVFDRVACLTLWASRDGRRGGVSFFFTPTLVSPPLLLPPYFSGMKIVFPSPFSSFLGEPERKWGKRILGAKKRRIPHVIEWLAFKMSRG